MISFTVPGKYNNAKVISVISKLYPKLPNSAIQKALRKRDIKVNGSRISENINIFAKDIIDVYLIYPTEKIDIIFEDRNIVAVNKPQGIEVLKSDDSVSLLELVKKQLNNDNIYPCHRLDRNTGGLILFAKNSEALKMLEEKIKENQIRKFYKCLVLGHFNEKSKTLNDYLFKDSKKSLVYISREKRTGYLPITTKYTVLSEDKETSLLEIELITGRTHQIRAHMAFIGHPVIGDGKYGDYDINKKFGKKYQELFAYKLIFRFTSDAGALNYLNGKEIEIKAIKNDNL